LPSVRQWFCLLARDRQGRFRDSRRPRGWRPHCRKCLRRWGEERGREALEARVKDFNEGRDLRASLVDNASAAIMALPRWEPAPRCSYRFLANTSMVARVHIPSTVQWPVGRPLRPFHDLSAAASRIGDGCYALRIAEHRQLKLAQICRGFSRMGRRLGEMDARNGRSAEQLAIAGGRAVGSRSRQIALTPGHRAGY